MKKDLIITGILISLIISTIMLIKLNKTEHYVNYNLHNIFPDSNSYQVDDGILIIPKEDIIDIENKIEQLQLLGPNKYYIMISSNYNYDLLDLIQNKTVLYEFNIKEFYLYDIPEWKTGIYARNGVLVLDITKDKYLATIKLPDDNLDSYSNAGPAAIKFKVKGTA